MQVLSPEAAAPALPAPGAGEPATGLLARTLHALRGQGALLVLRNPAAAFGTARIAAAEGVRLFAMADADDEACWDAMLALGQPVYGLRGRQRIDCAVLHPASAISSLAFGMYVCEDGMEVAELHEDRAGVRWRIAGTGPAEAQVIGRGGFPLATIAGTSGAYADTGREGVVRVVLARGSGRAWTQPRLVAPRQGGACGR